MSAKVIQVIETELATRGSGDDPSSPVRVIRQFWSLDGKLLAEVDPCAVTLTHERASELAGKIHRRTTGVIACSVDDVAAMILGMEGP